MQTVCSDYREIVAPNQLRNYFLCFWTQNIVGSKKNQYAHRVLPDGCIDIVFINYESPMVIGPWTKSFVVRFVAGTEILGVRLRPGYASTFLGVPGTELLNCSVPLSAVCSRVNHAEFARVSDQPSLAARSRALAEVLFGWLPYAAAFDQAIAAGIVWLGRHPCGRIKQLSEWIGISSRQVQRRFSSAVGYGPKMFQSVLRFQRLLYLGEARGGTRSLVDLAANAGYADQAHMTREVRRFAGCPPTALFPSAECTLKMSDLFKTG